MNRPLFAIDYEQFSKRLNVKFDSSTLTGFLSVFHVSIKKHFPIILIHCKKISKGIEIYEQSRTSKNIFLTSVLSTFIKSTAVNKYQLC